MNASKDAHQTGWTPQARELHLALGKKALEAIETQDDPTGALQPEDVLTTSYSFSPEPRMDARGLVKREETYDHIARRRAQLHDR